MSHNDEFWSGSQNDPSGNLPQGQSPHFGDSVFDRPSPDPADSYPAASNPQDPYSQDPYQQDPYAQDPDRRRLLATGPHEFGQSWTPAEDPFQEPFDPQQGGGRRDDFSAGGGGGRGFLVTFIVAAVLVALAAGAYAVYSVLQDTPDSEAAATDTTAASTTTTTVPTTTTTATTLPPGLNVQLVSPDFVCDSGVGEFGTISGADPNEEIAFASPQSPNLISGQADANGELPIRWSCSPDQIGTIWEMTATGLTSGLSGTVTFTGVAEGEATATSAEETTTTVAVDLGDLAITVTENPFTCDGEARAFGTISGATPNGEISFTSPQAGNIRSGTADEVGTRPVRWQCTAEQAGTIWQLTATDDATGRTVVFELTGN